MAIDPTRVKLLFQAAIERTDPHERSAFLDREVGGDADLRSRLDALLAVFDQPNPALESPLGTRRAAGDFLAGPDPVLAAAATVGLSDFGATLAGAGPVPEGPTVGLSDLGGGAEAKPAPRSAEVALGSLVAGRYKLRQVIGEGGMGTVYFAEQVQPVRRQVALKLIRAGMDSRQVLARFESERQALAIMDHPNIARVLDAGTTEQGHPFFVMELVRGVPLTDFCDAHRLDLPTRLNLFRQICAAVQHAHQKGIIHRDLKPTNILVEDHAGTPVPKVIDFGLAKATSGLNLTEASLFTAFGAIAGTLLYMAPEQATFNSLDIDTRADIYALGVILYEILTGSTPIRRESLQKAALDEIMRVIREDEPPTPSNRISTSEALPSLAATRQVEPVRLGRFVRGDLDWIVMKALAKERTRRYDSAIGLANDVERFLKDEPVTAGPPTARYRTAKFVRRHRGQVVAASLILLALIGGVVGTTLGLVAARRQEQEARRQANLATERAEGERRAKLDAQEKKALAEANERKAVAAAEGEKQAKETSDAVLSFVEDKVFAAARPQGRDGGLGYDIQLVDAITAALPAVEGSFAGKPLIEARLRMTIGRSFLDLDKRELAADQFAAARAIYTKHFGPEHPETIRSLAHLAEANTGQYGDPLKLMVEVLNLRKAKLGPDHPDTLKSMSSLAYWDGIASRNHAEAAKIEEEVLARRKAKLGPDHPDTLGSMNNLALSYFYSNRLAEALKLQEEGWAISKAKFGLNHPITLTNMANLAGNYSAAGRHAEAIKLAQQALALETARLGRDHSSTLSILYFLGFYYAAAGQHAEAIKAREEWLDRVKTKGGRNNGRRTKAFGMINLADSYSAVGRLAEALTLREEAVPLLQAEFRPDDSFLFREISKLAATYWKVGRPAETLKLREEVLARSKEKLGPDHPITLAGMADLATTFGDLKRHDEALQLREATLDLRRRKLGPDHPDTFRSMGDLADSLDALGRRDEAIKLRQEALALRRLKLPANHPDTLGNLSNLANSLLAAGRTIEALPLLEEYSAANPQNMLISLKVAALWAWFGREAEYVATRRRALAAARDTQDFFQAERAAKLASILPTSDRADLDAALTLARTGAKPGDEVPHRHYRLLALGMAAYRAGDDAAEPLRAAEEVGKAIPVVRDIAAFYQALSLHRRGRVDEARRLATDAAAVMRPLPSDEANPLAGDEVSHDDLIVWLAFKEAKALIGFDAPPAAPALVPPNENKP